MSEPALPFATSLEAPIPGRLKAEPEDFVVEELPAYEPEGEGEHLYLFVEKRGWTTPAAAERIARELAVPPRDAGWAGLKDRHAVTRQWLSFPRAEEAKALALELEGITVLRAARHKNKLRSGHLRGNRFELLLRDAPAERVADAQRVLDALVGHGVPNYFGEQRFGAQQSNVERARAWLALGGRAPRDRFDRKMLVSALQSAGFNALLSARVAAGELATVIDGDLCRREHTDGTGGGLFVVEDLETERRRAAAYEITATGPMFGASMRWPEGEARKREEAELARLGLDEEKLARFQKAGEGTRRPYRVRLESPRAEARESGIALTFTLPAGAYATVVARELTRVD